LTNRSAYGVASLLTRALLWEIAVPSNKVACGPPTLVGDLVVVARTGNDPNGTADYDVTKGGLVAIEKATGTVVVDYDLNDNFHGGVAIQDRHIFFGTSYSGFTPPRLIPRGLSVMRV
jgi:hypothetical protein